jgi:predicted PurR-regulated permease PerM
MTIPRKIEISHKTIIFTVLFLLLLNFLYSIKDILFQVFAALLIMVVLNPLVAKLSRFRIPRAISILVAYIIVLGLVGVVLAGVIPPLAEQTTNFVNGLPLYLENLGVSNVASQQIVGQLLTRIGDLPAQVAKITISFLSNILGIFTVLIFAFYLLLARDKLDDQLASFFGNKRSKRVAKVIDALEEKLGAWARGQLTLMFLVGVSSYVGLRILAIPFALPLAILAGLLEIVPYIGPVIAAIPAVIIGFGISPVIGLATIALAFLIQQLENYVFVPKVMEKSTGVSPLIVLLALAIGFRIAGVIGGLISIPVVITVQVLSKEYLLSK